MMLDDVSKFSHRDRKPNDRYEKIRENKLLKTMRNDTRLSLLYYVLLYYILILTLHTSLLLLLFLLFPLMAPSPSRSPYGQKSNRKMNYKVNLVYAMLKNR